jgi:protein gp37
MGCTKVSDGCRNCYAETLVTNRMGKPQLWGARGSRQRTTVQNWNKPRRWNREAIERGTSLRVFCASLCDVFEDRPDTNAWRKDLWDLVRETPALDWQILTKRPERIANTLPDDWGDGWAHVWLGTSIEDARVVDRARHLAKVPAAVHFISYEPALGPIADVLNLDGIEWVIYGGESGPGYRDEDKDWARQMFAACSESGAAFFHKQSAGYRTELGIELDGKLVRFYPQEPRNVKHLR